MQHVRTQLPYSLFVAVLALTCGYLPSVLGLRWGWCLLLALGAMLAFFFVLTRRRNSTPTEASQQSVTHKTLNISKILPRN